MLTPEQIADGWIEPTELAQMVGYRVLYRNAEEQPVVEIECWLDDILEGWAVIEFRDGSRATVRPSRIIAYRPEPRHD